MKRLLVCVDGSPVEREVVAQAAQLADKLEGTMVLFRAVTLPGELPPSALSLAPDDVQRVLVEGATRALQKLRDGLPAPRVEGTRVEIATPWRGIVAAARELDVDLIVIGSHGYGGIDRILGTTAGKVVDHADRSVLVIRPRP